MTPRQLVAIGASASTIALALSGATLLSSFGSFGTQNAATTTPAAVSARADAKTVDTPPTIAGTIAIANAAIPPAPVVAPPANVVARAVIDHVPADESTARESAVGTAVVPAADAATIAPDPLKDLSNESSNDPSKTAAKDAPKDPSQDPPKNPAKPGMALASLFTSDPAKELPKAVIRPLDTADECFVPETCIDDYLWALYQRAPKVDTNKVVEHFKVKVKLKKGKTKTVTKTNVKYVLGDFTWKDPIAAQKVGMSLKDYVIGGMDRAFKQKLFRAARVMEQAGLMPGITSAFRDDYRQSIAVGKTAASDSSYHGGSRRGGYGHGLAVDLVSVKGDTRMQRYAASEELWKWIDAHEHELGVGRPYLDRDPPHIGPLDGKEYADKRGRARVQVAAATAKTDGQTAESPAKKKTAQAKRSNTKKRIAAAETKRRVARSHHNAAKRAKPAKSSRTATLAKPVTAQR